MKPRLEHRQGLFLLSLLLACGIMTVASTAEWKAVLVETIEGMDVPECVLPDPENGVFYVSNIGSPEGEYWDDDNKGFILQIDATNTSKVVRWLEGTPEKRVDSPKGMCILDGWLYFTDNARLMRVSLEDQSKLEEIPLPETQRLNDLATDGTAVYVSDTALGCAYRVTPEGEHTRIQTPESVNGLTLAKGRMLGLSWDLHDIYTLDPEGKNPPEPWGLGEHFTALDGIEVLDDGNLIVSDFVGNKICIVEPDTKNVHTLVEIETPADIGLDRKTGLLYVPLFIKDTVAVFRLTKE